jgi:sigma-B regulation protein RsbU (phosphoserine phosphatase)
MRILTRSLRGKIFFAVVGLLLVLAAVVMPMTQRDVTRTVETSEQHAVENVLNLALRNTEARWSALLDEKIRSVRSERGQLMESGMLVQSVVAEYAELAEHGVISTDAAQALVRTWVNRLRLGDQRYAFIYDARHTVLASGAPGMIGRDISNIRDLKGRPLAEALRDESQLSGHGFALYRWPVPSATPQSGPTTETRYAHFGYFRAWDWIVAVSDNAQGILDQVQVHRDHMETSMRRSLSQLTLARSGFLFIMQDNGHLVVPPPVYRADLLDAVDQSSGQRLRELLQTHQAGGRSVLLSQGGDPWVIQTVHHKPLGWTLVAAVPQSDLTAAAMRLIHRQALIFGAALALALALAWLIATRITRPLDTLANYALSLPEQDLTAPAPPLAHIAELSERHRDEVGRLASSFLFMQYKLRENVARLLGETSARERFENELNIARDIQLGLLPIPLPRDISAQVELRAAMQPAKEVGGDLYDYFTLPDGSLCFAIGDVSDKGVPAALFMAVTRTLIRAAAEDETDPALIVQRVNNRLSENNPNMMFVTLLLGVLNLESGELAWVNAGHPPPAVVLATDGTVRILKGRSGPACGVVEDVRYDCLQARLEPGEILLGYTDGVTDAVNRQGLQYGDARLMARLSQPVGGAAELTKAVLDDVYRFSDNADPFDDITLIAVRRLP